MNSNFNLKQSEASQQGFVSIGNFDGVHLGHQAILSRLVELAEAEEVPSTVLTFEPHPVTILAPEFAPPRLTTLEMKSRLIRNLGVDHVIALPVTEDFLNLTAEEFFQEIIVKQFQAKGLVEGPNFFFGKNREGDPEKLAEFCEQEEMKLEIIRPEKSTHGMISSTIIRQLITEGKMDEAASLLGRPYCIEGIVTEGEKRGRKLGFPTANLDKIPVLIPRDGVYAGYTEISGQRIAVALNIGPNPTFHEQNQKIEAHLLNFSQDLYHSSLEISIVERIRSIYEFPSIDELVEQLKKDRDAVEKIINIPKS